MGYSWEVIELHQQAQPQVVRQVTLLLGSLGSQMTKSFYWMVMMVTGC